MPRLEDVAFKPASWHEVNTTTNAVVSATKAGEANHRHMITGWSFSTSGTPVNSGTLFVKDGGTVIDQMEVNKDSPNPLKSSERWMLSVSSPAVMTCSALGAGILTTVVIHGTTIGY